MLSNHLILCQPLLLLPSVFPSTRLFSNESVLLIRWPEYWSFSFSIVLPMNIQGWFPLGVTGLISLQSFWGQLGSDHVWAQWMEPQLRARCFGRCWKHRTRPPYLPSDDLPDKSDQTTRTDCLPSDDLPGCLPSDDLPDKSDQTTRTDCLPSDDLPDKSDQTTRTDCLPSDDLPDKSDQTTRTDCLPSDDLPGCLPSDDLPDKSDQTTRTDCLPSDDLPDKSDQTTRTDFCRCWDSALPRKLCYYCLAFSLRWAIIGVSKESFTLKIFDFKIMKTCTTGFFSPNFPKWYWKSSFRTSVFYEGPLCSQALCTWSDFSQMVFWSRLRSVYVQRSARTRRGRGAAPFKINILILINFWYHVALLTHRTQKGLFHWTIHVSHRDIYTIMLMTSWPAAQLILWWSSHGNDRLSRHMMC